MSTARPTFHTSDFHKSSFSDPNQSCVEIARQASWVEVRDSKTVFGSPADRRLAFTAQQFALLLDRS